MKSEIGTYRIIYLTPGDMIQAVREYIEEHFTLTITSTPGMTLDPFPEHTAVTLLFKSKKEKEDA